MEDDKCLSVDGYGFVRDFSECEFIHGLHMSELTIRPPHGTKIGTNLARAAMSAPELLEALQTAMQYWRWWIEDHPNSVGPTERDDFAAAENAIAKATGK